MLDRVDETLETQMHRNPSLLLIQPADQQQRQQKSFPSPPAPAAADADAVVVVGSDDKAAEGGDGGGSSRAGEVVLGCLKFLAVLMRNCVNKHVFSSSEVCLVCLFVCVRVCSCVCACVNVGGSCLCLCWVGRWMSY